MVSNVIPFRKRKRKLAKTRLTRGEDNIPSQYEFISKMEAIEGLARIAKLQTLLARLNVKAGRKTHARILNSCRLEAHRALDHIIGSFDVRRIERTATRWRALGLLPGSDSTGPGAA